MVVTAVADGVSAAVSNGMATLGAILILCLVTALIAQEALGHHKDNPYLSYLHRALKLIWAPLATATVVVLAQQLVYVGVL